MPSNKKQFIFFVICFLNLVSFGQSKDNLHIRLRPVSGGSVQFVVNSIQKYNTGLAYEGWTTFSVFFVDSADLSKKWDLYVYAETQFMEGDFHNLNLDYLELEVINATGTGTIELPTSPGFGELNAKPLLTNTERGAHTLKISYRCGKGADKLLGNLPDYYQVILVFFVRPST